MITNKKTKKTVIAARILLGMIYFVFGLNFFLHFIPNSSQPEGKAAAFIGGLFQSGFFFPEIKLIEVIAGALLLFGLFTPLLLVILMPITVNILLFHSILQPGGFPIILSSLILFLEIFLAWNYRDTYKHLFIARQIV